MLSNESKSAWGQSHWWAEDLFVLNDKNTLLFLVKSKPLHPFLIFLITDKNRFTIFIKCQPKRLHLSLGLDSDLLWIGTVTHFTISSRHYVLQLMWLSAITKVLCLPVPGRQLHLQLHNTFMCRDMVEQYLLKATMAVPMDTSVAMVWFPPESLR